MEQEKPWWKPSKLEAEFVTLSYEEIGRVLDLLGTRFAAPFETIPKQHLFATLEHDCPAEVIAAAIGTTKRNPMRRGPQASRR